MGATRPRMADQRSDRPSKLEPPADIQERIDRGLAEMRSTAPKRNEQYSHWRGDTYAYVNAENQLVTEATAPSTRVRGGKPNHRVRMKLAMVTPIVRQEVSYATSRVPTYEVNPSNSDPQTTNAAHMASQVAIYGYDKWKIKNVTEDVVTHALVGDEGFAWPYWDSTMGPSVGLDEETETEVHEGEICVRTYSANEVGWEPGVAFEDSRWYIVVQARPVDVVKEMEGYLTGDLNADAQATRALGSSSPRGGKLVLVTEYLERPSQKYPKGRRLCMANNRVIAKGGDYPLQGPDGEVVDEPVLLELTMMRDPDLKRGLGMVRFLLDPARQYQDARNKQAEWKNLAMNPQMVSQPGMLRSPLTDEPGATILHADPQRLVWRPTPPAPPLLGEIQDRAKQDIGYIAAQNEIPNQVEAARAIQVIMERDQNARSAFIARLAEFHSRLMRHCLSLVAQHYTEGRLIKINGWSGPERIEDFKGADLMDQVDVRVNPGSIEPLTRAFMEQRIMNWAQLGWIEPHQAMSAIEGGNAEGLIKSYELDIGRANWIIQRIFTDHESVMAAPDVPNAQFDPNAGQPQVGPDGAPIPPKQIPFETQWWMPRPFDRIPVYKNEFENAMKTQRYDLAPNEVKLMLILVYKALLQLEADEAARQAAAQMDMAQGLGMGNAAKEQTTNMPSMPGISGPGGQVDPAAGQQ